MLNAWIWARQARGAEGQRGGVLESTRWIKGKERVAERARALLQVRQLYVADREADIMALLRRARELGRAVDYLIRCQHDRAVAGASKLWARLAPVMGEVQFELPAGRARKARAVKQCVRVQRIEMGEG